jgi:hypothetical protein
MVSTTVGTRYDGRHDISKIEWYADAIFSMGATFKVWLHKWMALFIYHHFAHPLSKRNIFGMKIDTFAMTKCPVQTNFHGLFSKLRFHPSTGIIVTQ